MSKIEDITAHNLPNHLAIIMDGNGRWAKERGKHRVFGHENGDARTPTSAFYACTHVDI